jgi:hypothetical protein
VAGLTWIYDANICKLPVKRVSDRVPDPLEEWIACIFGSHKQKNHETLYLLLSSVVTDFSRRLLCTLSNTLCSNRNLKGEDFARIRKGCIEVIIRSDLRPLMRRIRSEF